MTKYILAFLCSLSVFGSAHSARAQDAADSAYPAGDVFFLQFLEDHDQQMLQEDYQNFLPTLQRLSRAGFRVTMNWRASVRDLKLALQNKRPTVIIFSSHGRPKGITDKLDEDILLPADFFKGVSPTVYQFIVATCYGTPALKNYDLSDAKNIKFKAWDVPITTGHLKDFLSTWNFMDNYPKNRVFNGLTCQASGNEFQLRVQKTGRVLSRFAQYEECMRAWTLSAESLVCAQKTDQQLALFDTQAGRYVDGSYFPLQINEWCYEAPSRIRKNQICYLNDKFSFSVYDVAVHKVIPGLEFSQKEECQKAIWSK